MTPLVVLVQDLSTGARSQFAFARSPVRIGRSEINDLPLPQPFVSNWHAVVQFDEEGAYYVDLGSTNGSLVGETRLEKNVPMRLGADAEVRIGGLLLTFARRATATPPATPRPATMFAMRITGVVLPPPSLETPPPGAAPGATPPLEAAPLAAPPPAPPELVPDEIVEQAIEAAALDLDLLYASYRGSWEHLRSRIEQAAVGMEGPARAAIARRLAERYPEMAAEPQFREMAGRPSPREPAGGPPPPGAAPAVAPPAGADAESAALLRTFGESYLPASARVETRAEAEEFLGRLAEALETFARSYVEMRKGYEEFGREMGVRTVQGDGPVERARDARQLVAYLLDPAHQGRAGELRSAFADLMLHQVALLSGVAEGAKALLRPLHPEAIAAESPQGIWPMKAQSLWKAYEARFHELFDEESAISDALFGSEFAKAYTAIVGKRAEVAAPGPVKPRRR